MRLCSSEYPVLSYEQVLIACPSPSLFELNILYSECWNSDILTVSRGMYKNPLQRV